MKHLSCRATIAGCVLVLGCGSDPNSAASASAGEDAGSTGNTTVPATTGTTGDSATNASVSASATVGESSSAGAEEGNDSGPLPVKLDVLGIPDAAIGACGGKGGGSNEPDFSYIWVANSTEGTVSKINTVSLEEEGRYRTRMDPNGSPSRTSVSLNGDVAVANREGGVIKISARLEGCPDPSNTSSGAADVKPFPDGCVAWFTPFNYTSQRPVAWAPGTWSDITCRYEDEMLWTSGAQGEAVEVLLLNGEDGAVEETIPILGTPAGFYGIYGGASDADGNFWGSQLGIGNLVRVDRNNFEYEEHPMVQSGYGMTVDTEGRPWTCSSGVARFDPDDGTWQTNPNVGGGGGCMVDADGHLWIGGYGNAGGNMISIDTETLAVDQTIPIPNYVHGVSIDFYGYVWGVTLQQPFAYRVDPADGTFETFAGLTGPYTYSDMTGWALSNVVGGGPSG
jgi:hypothetical protein